MKFKNRSEFRIIRNNCGESMYKYRIGYMHQIRTGDYKLIKLCENVKKTSSQLKYPNFGGVLASTSTYKIRNDTLLIFDWDGRYCKLLKTPK
jgi:hypothetical protein